MNEDIPRAKKGAMCPQFRKDVSKVCHTCAWWTGITWKDPATGETKHKWSCAMVMAALTNIDVVKATTGTQAATESFRNEMVLRSGIAPLGAMTDHRAPSLANGSSAPKLIEQMD